MTKKTSRVKLYLMVQYKKRVSATNVARKLVLGNSRLVSWISLGLLAMFFALMAFLITK